MITIVSEVYVNLALHQFSNKVILEQKDIGGTLKDETFTLPITYCQNHSCICCRDDISRKSRKCDFQ